MSNQVAASQSGHYDTGPPFVFGFGFKNGISSEMKWEDVAVAMASYDWTWLHLNMNNAETATWLRAQKDIPFAAASALLAGETRPRVTSFGNGLVVNLRGVNLNEGAEPEDMVSIRIWMDKKRIISTRRRRLAAAQDIRQEIVNGAKISGPSALLSKLAARLITRMEPYVLQIEETVDDLEEDILNGAGAHLRARLAEARQTAVHFRRFVAPQRDAIARLVSEDTDFIDRQSQIELRESADKVTRLTEEIDAARERAMVLQDQLTDQRAEEMNRNMMVLAIAAAVFLPLGFVTGLFGINVGGMPGIDNPAAFWLVVLSCAFIGAALVTLFKVLKWW